MKEKFSVKVSNLNVILTCMIVFIHSSCERFLIFNSHKTIEYIYRFNDIFLHLAVGFFYLISAYLMYRNINTSNLKYKIKKRIRTILIPYFIWSIIFFVYYYALNRIGIINNDNYSNLSIFKIANLLFWKGTFHTSWFIRDLIIFYIFSPILLEIGKNKSISICLLLAFIILGIIFDFEYSQPLYWLPIYFCGITLGMHYSKKIESSNDTNRIIQIISLLILLVLTIITIKYPMAKSLYLYRIFGLIPFYIFLSNSHFIYKKNVKLINCTFLIIILHTAIIQILNQSLISIFGITPLISLIYSLLSGVAAILLTYTIYLFLNKYCKKLLLLLTGGRGERTYG